MRDQTCVGVRVALKLTEYGMLDANSMLDEIPMILDPR
jgi:hypothetical protein